MDRHPSVGLSTCRIYRYDDTYAWAPRRYPTIRSSLGRRFDRWNFVARAADDIRYSRRDPLSTFACDWFTGCFFFARQEAVRRVGPLDEGFVKYYEDVDWCAQLNAAGDEVAHYGGTHCFHAEQRASKRILSADGRRHLRSYARWMWKWRRRPPSAGDFTLPAEPGLSADVALPHDLMRNGRTAGKSRSSPRRGLTTGVRYVCPPDRLVHGRSSQAVSGKPRLSAALRSRAPAAARHGRTHPDDLSRRHDLRGRGQMD
ncbi:MAG: hypothetical protein QM775_36290 [Pirellulales bacterium]